MCHIVQPEAGCPIELGAPSLYSGMLCCVWWFSGTAFSLQFLSSVPKLTTGREIVLKTFWFTIGANQVAES